MKNISFSGVGVRFVIALVLVCITWNPIEFSYLSWAIHNWSVRAPVVVFLGIVLLICWVVFLRATIRSLGPVGITLALAFCASLVWLFVYFELVDLGNTTALAWLLLVLLAFILAAGMSWSHLRRRWAGQADVDDVDED